MTIEITNLLDFKKLRLAISNIMNIPINRILKWGEQQNVSEFKFFITVKDNQAIQYGVKKSFNKTTEIQEISTLKETNVIVGFHGDNAVNFAELFQLALSSEVAINEFLNIGCSVLRGGDVSNLTIPFGGGYEQRAEVQVVLSNSFIIEHKQNRIESAEIEMEINE